VLIGGGVRVGDAFQAIVGYEPIAKWVTEICVEISQAGRTRLVRDEQERDTHSAADGTGEAGERGKSEWAE
jgi:hypothetical protein